MKLIFNIQKVLVLPLAIIVIFFSAGAPRANAQLFVPVFDSLHTTQTTIFAGFQDITKMALDTLAYTAAQTALDMMTQNTVSWIKGGFNGSPAFAIDPSKLFLDVANQVSGGLANQILGINTCNFSPNFNTKLANQVTLSTRSGANAKFQDAIRCPFPAGAGNAQGFYNNFNQGGWRAFETSLTDNGNPFGTALLTSQELAARQAETQSIKQQELGWAGGFLSTQQCDGVDSYTGQPILCHATTPGKIIGDQLNTALGTDSARLGFADNMNKIFAALIGQLTKSVTTGVFK